MQQAKSLTFEWLENDDKIALRFGGELSRNTLLPLWQQRAVFFQAAQNFALIEWDLAQLARIDSAGFALLCDFLRFRQTQAPQQQQRLIHFSDQLLTLADLYGLSQWIRQFTHSTGTH